MADQCAACLHPEDQHDDVDAGGLCWVCGSECPDGYVPPEEQWDPAEDHDPIPGLRIRAHGSA